VWNGHLNKFRQLGFSLNALLMANYLVTCEEKYRIGPKLYTQKPLVLWAGGFLLPNFVEKMAFD